MEFISVRALTKEKKNSELLDASLIENFMEFNSELKYVQICLHTYKKLGVKI